MYCGHDCISVSIVLLKLVINYKVVGSGVYTITPSWVHSHLQSSSSYGIRSYGIHSQIPWYGMASGLLPNALSPLQNTSHMEYPRYGMGLASILAGLPTLFHTRNSTVPATWNRTLPSPFRHCCVKDTLAKWCVDERGALKIPIR
jgi:hypothetical protein